MFYREEKLAIFIDGANLYAAARSLGFDIDYKKLLSVFAERSQLIRAFYYTTLIEDQDYSPIRPLVDWLDYNGYTMITKPTREYTDSNGRRKVKGNMDVELATDVMEASDNVDHIMIFSGDGDFRRLLEAVQRKGVRVTIVSTLKSSPPMVSDDLRRQADNFIDLYDLMDEVGRKNADGKPIRFDIPESVYDNYSPNRPQEDKQFFLDEDDEEDDDNITNKTGSR
jgi:uncharacterized LabA/DUF88 family protein